MPASSRAAPAELPSGRSAGEQSSTTRTSPPAVHTTSCCGGGRPGGAAPPERAVRAKSPTTGSSISRSASSSPLAASNTARTPPHATATLPRATKATPASLCESEWLVGQSPSTKAGSRDRAGTRRRTPAAPGVIASTCPSAVPTRSCTDPPASDDDESERAPTGIGQRAMRSSSRVHAFGRKAHNSVSKATTSWTSPSTSNTMAAVAAGFRPWCGGSRWQLSRSTPAPSAPVLTSKTYATPSAVRATSLFPGPGPSGPTASAQIEPSCAD
mmetsp:Transcript_12384/g.31329  ORF Transcript_12384/g.31329 Transcript_12384/m.31329 type:complete len:271 (-) Transcript_12384:259-1071(-)